MKYLRFIIPIIIVLALAVFFLAKNRHTQATPAPETPEIQTQEPVSPPAKVADISKVPILTYHSFGPAPEKKETAMQLHYRITSAMFDAQMKYLVDHGYHSITFADLVENQLNGKPIPDNAIVLTFDDGWKSQYDFALPILEKYKLTGTFFIITGSTGAKSYMTTDELKTLVAKGFEVASHTVSHPKLPTLDDTKMTTEIISSKKTLEDKLGVTVKTLAYPYYAHNQHVMDVVQQAGYIGARAGWEKFSNDPSHLFEMKSQEPVNNPNPFASKRIAG